MTLSHRGIADAIAARIKAGEWGPGDKVPTTLEFADHYGVSEATAYRALSLLIDRGQLVGESGRGRFVPGGPADGRPTSD